MTVCIAAMSDTLGVIVTMTDLMISSNEGAMDGADTKVAHLLGNGPWSRWFCFYSGLPGVFDDLADYIRRALAVAPDYPWSKAELMSVVANAYDEIINRRIEREVLRQQYGMDYKQFRALQSSNDSAIVDQVGQKITEAHGRIVNEMLYQDPTDLLVCGFDENLRPQIFSADGIGRCVPRNRYGFHAIGSGGPAAEAWLLANKEFLYADRISEIAYRLCEAKFMAENSPHVGKAGFLSIWFSTGVMTPILLFAPPSETPIEAVRTSWLLRIVPQPRTEALNEIERQIRSTASIQKKTVYLSKKERDEIADASKLGGD